MKFRILIGRHIDEQGRLYEGPLPPRGVPGSPDYRPGKEGDVIDTTLDLVTRFNQPNSIKFAQVDELTPAKYEDPAKTGANEAAYLEKQLASVQERLNAARARATPAPVPDAAITDAGSTATAVADRPKVHDNMSLNDLRRMAQAEEIDVPADCANDRKKLLAHLRSKGF